MSFTPLFESFEPRRLFTFLAPSVGFGDDGYVGIANPKVAFDTGSVAVPLADGRVVVSAGEEVRFLRGDGVADRDRGTRGVVDLSGFRKFGQTVHDVAVDHATGRVAVLIGRQQGVRGPLVLWLYDAKGRLDATRDVADTDEETGSLPLAFARDGSGGLYLGTFESGLSTEPLDVTIRRFDASLAPDPAFATVRFQAASAGPILPDATGRVTIVSQDEARGSTTTVVRLQARQFDAAGRAVAGYGGGGSAVATLDEYVRDNATYTSDNQFLFRDADVDANGVLYVATLDGYRNADDGATAFRRLTRYVAGGGATQNLDLGASAKGEGLGAVAIQSPSVVYYVARAGGRNAASVARVNVAGDGAMRVDPAFGSFDGFAPSTIQVGYNPTVDVRGRLFFAGFGRAGDGADYFGVFAADGAVEAAPRLPDAIRLRGDGTLVVRGTGGADRIEVRAKRRVVYVTLNDRVVRFAGASVRGVLVESGGGNDSISFGATFGQPVYVNAGAGNDRVTAGAGGATLLGGSGHDLLIGGNAIDELWGEGGDDTLVGDFGIDRFHGGPGDDLYARPTDDIPIRLDPPVTIIDDAVDA